MIQPQQHFSLHKNETNKPVNVTGNSELLAQLLGKLLANVVEFTINSADIHISLMESTQQNKAYVTLEIENTGHS